MKTIVLGLGNTILSDDGVGIYVLRKVQSQINAAPFTIDDSRFTFREASIGGFNFIDTLVGYDRAIIIDAIHTKDGRPGDYYELSLECLKPSARISSLHGIDLATACKMAGDMKVDFPKEIRIFVMEVEDEFSFGEKCTPAVDKAIPRMAQEILKCLVDDKWISFAAVRDRSAAEEALGRRDL